MNERLSLEDKQYKIMADKSIKDLQEYQHFVEERTSIPSNSTEKMIERIKELKEVDPEINVSLLMTSAMGMTAEAGEFAEIVKKLLFQGKPLNRENRIHMEKELGDIFWYMMNACRALSVSPYTIIDTNIKKLKARYPEGFEVKRSEHRDVNDI